MHWHPWLDECECGSSVRVYTRLDPGWCDDGDAWRCDAGHVGYMDVGDDEDDAWLPSMFGPLVGPDDRWVEYTADQVERMVRGPWTMET